jgi:pimeloyl-ACP methyl ester carboxylesterase
METAKVNGVELEYEVTGSGEPVLLISPVLADGFLPFLSEQALVDGYRLIRYHRRGWAGSTHTPPPVSIATHAADAAALLEHFGVDRAHVAGHGSSGAIALQLAVDRPDLVHTLALLEPALLSVPGAAAFLEKAGPAFAAYGAGDREAAVTIFLSAVSGLDRETCRAVIDAQVPGGVAQATKDADTFFGIELPALGAWAFGPEQARTIGQPVLSVIGSGTERLFVEVASLLRSWIPQIEDCMIEGVGHLLHIQRPEPVARAMAEFLGRNSFSAFEGRRASGGRWG